MIKTITHEDDTITITDNKSKIINLTDREAEEVYRALRETYGFSKKDLLFISHMLERRIERLAVSIAQELNNKDSDNLLKTLAKNKTYAEEMLERIVNVLL